MTSPSPEKSGLRVVVLNDSSVAKGGATGLATLAARMLADRGIQTTFITGDAGDDGALEAAGVTLKALGGKLLLDAGKLQAMRKGIYNSEVHDSVAAHIVEHDTPETVYHLHGWSRILSPAVLDALKPVAGRTFIHAHDFFLGCPNGAFYDFRNEEVCTRTPLSFDCLKTACDRRAYHHKLWRSARGATMRKRLGDATAWAKIFTLHPGMTEPLIRSGLSANAITPLRNPAKALTADRVRAEENKTFCFIGRLEVGKGIHTLCAAARMAGIPLRVIGDGVEAAKLRADYPEVTFTGWIDQAKIGEHLADVRALVMPSRTPEPFGLVAAEASLSGLPVILSEQSLLSQDIERNELGYAAATQAPEDLARQLKRLAELPSSKVKEMSERAYAGTARIAQSPDSWISQTVDHYMTAVSAE